MFKSGLFVMKNRFNKDELIFLEKFSSKFASARDYYWLGRKQEEQKYYSYHTNRISFALQQSAYSGDEWGMNELGLLLLNEKDRLPEALSWIYQSAIKGNEAAKKLIYDKWSEVYSKVMTYSIKDNSEYANLEVKSAMLTAMLLIHLGLDDWNSLKEEDKIYRVSDLVNNLTKIYGIPDIKVEFLPELLYNNGQNKAQGLAYPGAYLVQIESGLLYQYERLIQVIFHEVGHHIVYTMMNNLYPRQNELFNRFGLTKERIEKWQNNEIGYAITLNEEDPDTISYGVWWTYYLYFPKK